MISDAVVKANVCKTIRNKKTGGFIFIIRSTLLEIQCKKDVYFI